LDTVRAQKSTVPVALTPKLAEPGAFEVEEFAEEPLLGLGEDEHPAAASTRAVAEKTARAAGLRIFMCGSFRHLRKKGCDWDWPGGQLDAVESDGCRSRRERRACSVGGYYGVSTSRKSFASPS
jgi:hypothetical protein